MRGMAKTDPTIQVCVRLPLPLVETIDAIARDAVRTRSSQIEWLLKTSVEIPPASMRDPAPHQETA